MSPVFRHKNSPATCRAYTLYQLYLRDPDYSLEGIILLLYYVEHVVDPVGIRELYAPRLLRHVSCAVPDFRESYLPPPCSMSGRLLLNWSISIAFSTILFISLTSAIFLYFTIFFVTSTVLIFKLLTIITVTRLRLPYTL